MKESNLVKKEYVKAEVEFVEFNYSVVCSDSAEIEEQESFDIDDFDFASAVPNVATALGFGNYSNDESENENTDGGGYAITDTSDETDTNKTSDDTVDDAVVENTVDNTGFSDGEDSDGGIGEAFVDMLTGNGYSDSSDYSSDANAGGGSEATEDNKGFPDTDIE